MKRRKMLQIAGAGAATCLFAKGVIPGVKADQDTAAITKKKETTPTLAAPCGLYCGVCPAYVDGKCHGICGCSCGKCPGALYAKECGVAKCVFGKKLQSCAECPEMPCSKLVAATYDLLYPYHQANIENLRRRKKIGDAAWLAEQKELWGDAKKRDLWIKLIRESWQKAAEYEK